MSNVIEKTISKLDKAVLERVKAPAKDRPSLELTAEKVEHIVDLLGCPAQYGGAAGIAMLCFVERPVVIEVQKAALAELEKRGAETVEKPKAKSHKASTKRHKE